MEIIFFIAFIVAIIVTSAIISGSEAALLSVSYTKAKEIVNENPTSSRAKNLLKI